MRTILTSRGDKTDGKIRRCRRNKGECLETGVERWTARGKSSLPFLSLSFLKLHAAVRIAYGIPVESRTVERGARSRRLATYIHIYMYVASESTWYYEREEESRNRKRFTPTCTLPIVRVSRVEEARGRPMG